MSESKAREIESYVKKWMAHPENLGTIPTNESGQYIFKNKNNDSINLGVYFEMILSDYIKDHSQQSAEVSEEIKRNGTVTSETIITTEKDIQSFIKNRTNQK